MAVFGLGQCGHRLLQRQRQVLLHRRPVHIVGVPGGIGVGGIVQVSRQVDDLAGGQQPVQRFSHRYAVHLSQLNIQHRQLVAAVLLPHRAQQCFPAFKWRNQRLLSKIFPQPGGGRFPQLSLIIAYRYFYHPVASTLLSNYITPVRILEANMTVSYLFMHAAPNGLSPAPLLCYNTLDKG